jgi:hypothetical protein
MVNPVYLVGLNSVKDSFSFWPLVTFSVTDNIASVIPGDLNYDGQLDLLIITVDSTDEPNSYINYFFRTQSAPFFGPESGQPDLTYTITNQTQPFVLDMQGDRRYGIVLFEN